MVVVLFDMIMLSAAPGNISAPLPVGFNATVMSVQWSKPLNLNGPVPVYALRRFSPAFSFPPPSVEAGVHFTGLAYHVFPPQTIPQGVAFTGQFGFCFMTHSLNISQFINWPGQFFTFKFFIKNHCLEDVVPEVKRILVIHALKLLFSIIEIIYDLIKCKG